MAHPRKKRRTQTPGTLPAKAPTDPKPHPSSRTPKSMVIRMGASNVGPSVTQLVHDTRQVMEPHTAARLRERRANKLRDYTTMAGPLGVSHFLLFSRGKESGNVNLRLGITPRGPTLGFRVEDYSLCRDIVKSQKHPKGGAAGTGVTHTAPPLLVLNNFKTPDATSSSRVPKHLENLLTSTFQSLFPPIAPQETPLSSIRRILLLNRERDPEDDGAYVVNLRHYAISTRTLHPGLSRGLKRLQRAERHAISRQRKPQPGGGDAGTAAKGISTSSLDAPNPAKKRKTTGALPNMNRLDDVADYLMEGGYTSASETEVDTDAEVEVYEPEARRVLNRKERQRIVASRAAARSQQENGDGHGANGGELDGERAEADGPNEAAQRQAAERRSRRRPPVQKRAVKLTELGPRMKLRLLKVEEGLCEGKVMWHEFIEKSAAEERKLDAVWEGRRREKEERRRVQRENLEAKRKLKRGKKADGEGDVDEEGGEGDEGISDMDDDVWDEVDDDEEMEGQQG